MLQVLLRDPEFGNTYGLVSNTRIHRTLNGSLRTLQGNAPVWQRYDVHFKALSLDEITKFITYLESTFGNVVTLVDFEGRSWTGMIVSPSIPIFTGRAGCNYSTEFDFEGQGSGP